MASARLAFNVDPIGALARTGALPGSVEEEMAQAASFARDAGPEFPQASMLRADSRPVHEAGGTEVQELAYLVGLSRQRVNQALATLDEAGLIEVAYGGLRVIDLQGLRSFVWRGVS